MLAPLLAALLAALPQDTVVDRPVFTDAAYGVRLPRPDADWVFVPAVERGTMTVIFHPRGAALSDQLWGALLVTRWGGPVPLEEIADRRVQGTWRPAFGRSFTLLARDSLAVAGFPAIHLIMGGTIEQAVVDVEEYLVARDTDLVVLQFRLPRGQPRDTVSAGYQRVVEGLDLRRPGTRSAPAAPPLPAAAEIAIVDGQLVVELPETLMAVGPGALTSQAVGGGRRLVRWSPDAPGQPPSIVTVGRYVSEERTVGRLRLAIWRLPPDDSTAARVTDDVVSAVAQAWARCWLALGPVPRVTFTLVETTRATSAGATGIVLVGRDADAAVLAREVARTWWGGYVRPDEAAPMFAAEWLPQWSAWLTGAAPPADSGRVREGFERARTLAGDARLREALRTLAAEGRDGASSALFLSYLDERSSTALRTALP